MKKSIILQSYIDSVINEESDKISKFSQKFMKWFSGSKVVGNDGEPLRLYHGTTSDDDFEDFNGSIGIGWFTPQKEYAENYGRVIDREYYLSIKKPYVLPIKILDDEITFEEFKKKTKISNVTISPKLFRYNFDINEPQPAYVWYNPKYTDFLEVIEEKGYDGFQTSEMGHPAFLPFDNSQIRYLIPAVKK